MGLDKELVKQLYANGLNAREISEQLNENKSAVNKCIQRNFKDLKPIHLKNRKYLKFYEDEVKKITKYESKQYMSDKTFILKNRSIYKTEKDGDIVLKKDIGCAVPWDVPRRLTNEFK
ncbi:MAG: DNA-binding response regulator [Peptostreptococcaceae bacterium]|nr:DNA-binding response regulator [Peptostreptococcaceae bacterium]